jgi:hypothetical protein
MRRSVRRRHGVAAAALAISMVFALPQAPVAAGSRVRTWVCDFQWRDSTFQLKQLIRCAARRWMVPGGPDKAISVARCESHLDPAAYGSGNAGLFQQAVVYWPARARGFGFAGASPFNGRANAIVSIRMAHASGWAAWSCA